LAAWRAEVRLALRFRTVAHIDDHASESSCIRTIAHLNRRLRIPD